MYINTVELTNIRGFTHAKLIFQPGFNLVVGVNGVGKTTILESVRVLLSHILTEIKSPIIVKDYFSKSDININTNSLQLNSSFTVDEQSYEFLYRKSAKDYTIVQTEQPKRTKASVANIREEAITLEDRIEFKTPINRFSNDTLLGIFFSTRRSAISRENPKISNYKLPHSVAFVESLSSTRSFNVKMFAEWFKVQKALAKENSKFDRVIQLVKQTVYTFLPAFSDLEIQEDEISKELTFHITKFEKALSFTQLSDGERGLLALVFDISRRLIIANIDKDNPLEGKAVILIDELDLHLHPRWQRTVVSDLLRTFPNCQFIATTHSPQIISSVLPGNIQIIKDFEVDQTVKSFGLDINWILKFIMEDDDRLAESVAAIASVQKLFDNVEFEEARLLIDSYKLQNLQLDEWVIFEAKMSHLEMFEDEEDN